MSNDMLRMLVLKTQLLMSTRGPNSKVLPISKHGNDVVCHCLKWRIFDEILL